MNSLTVLVVAFAAIFLTSLLSGIVGMAGGLILITVLILLMPLPSAMILHGIVQGIANGSRFWFLREHAVWSILPFYFIGIGIATAFFIAFNIVADPAIVLIAAGTLPWMSQLTPARFRLDITRPHIAVVCGVVTTAAQLIAGASGPILDAFYQRADLNRFEIVSTKALTQTIGHLVKTAYFVYIGTTFHVETHQLLSWWFISIAIMLSLAGTRLGTHVLERIREEKFQRWTNVLLLTLGAIVAISGAIDLLQR